MIGNLSGPTLIVILFIVLLLFGAPKLPGLARSLGQSMKILRKEVSSDRDGSGDDAGPAAPTSSTEQKSPTEPERPATPPAAPAAPQHPTPPEVPGSQQVPPPAPESPVDPENPKR
ncbi:twin-arginine translocase TatA/TatE family subunit [Leucobacter sp. USCH14]|uniref:Sec-independent protein translocase subunit TatA/TatB n=1 Tax=Leucobacter sp. USCH14 TaxID=3024838 RepID=UPI00309E208C